METTQIYELVNDVNEQAFGQSAIAVNDLQGLIALGDTVFTSAANTEAWLNTLAQRIGRTIVRFRMYTNKLSDMVLTDFEWGAILQKISVEMPEAEEDESWDIQQDETYDHYEVNKLPTKQKLFVTRTPYQFHITIPRYQLREAFLSESGMGALIGAMFGQVRNKIETTLENLGRATIAAGVVMSTDREIALLTEYNTIAGVSLTAAGALLDDGFLRYAIRRIKETMDSLTDMSVSYNDGTIPTFTPYEYQRFRIISKFERALETVVEWAAFNEDYVKLTGYSKLNFWQAEKDPYKILAATPDDGTETTVSNVIAVIHDRDAVGIYQEFEEILTTPVNAKGAFYNQYWHRKDGRMLDTSENFVYLTLN